MHKLGETVRFEAKFYNVLGGALTGATVTVNIYNPSETLIVSAGSTTERAGGRYSYDYTPDVVGDWKADFITTNTNADLLSVPDRQQIVAATYFQTDVSALATQTSVTALGSPMQAGASVTVGANTDKTGYALTSAYDAAKVAASQASVTALGSPLQATGYTAPDNAGIAAIQAKTDNLPAAPAATGDAMTLTTAYDAAKSAASQTSVDTIQSGVSLLTGGSGIFAVTIQCYRTGTATPIADVSACVVDANGEMSGICQRSSAGGLCVFALNAGDYSVRLLKSGYQFAVEDVTVAADLTQTVYGEAVTIPAAGDVESCMVYEYCFDAAAQSPLSRVTATAAIISLPYNYAGRLYSCANVSGTYDADTGLVSWELVRGAVVFFKIQEVGVARRVTIPNAATARLSDLR